MAAVFQRRRLRVTFRLAVGTFARDGEPDTVELEDFRTEAEIDNHGGAEFAMCRLRIYGLDKAIMDRLTYINYLNLDMHRNELMVEATDDDGNFNVIFFGEIFESQPEWAGMPNVPLSCTARSGLIGSLAPAASSTYPGSQRVSAIMSRLARELGAALEDNGVTETVTDQVLVGSPLTKVQTLAEAARIQYWYAPEQQILAIAPRGASRSGTPVEYSASTGLVGFPTRLHNGIAFTALFRPSLFSGCPIRMESDVPACNGDWYVISMSHRLSGNLPGGPWFTQVVATPFNTTIRTR